MVRHMHIGRLAGAVAGLLFALGPLSDVMAGEVHFVAGQVSPTHAIWHPGSVLIDNTSDLKDGLIFVLENPTDTEHGFAVRGLMQEVETKQTEATLPQGGPAEELEFTYKPLRVIVPAHQTVRVRVATDDFEGAQAEGRSFRFFCPIHKDVHLAGSIFVVR